MPPSQNPKDIHQQLADAITGFKGIEEVNRCLQEGADPKTLIIKDLPALFYAVKYGAHPLHDITAAFVKAGVDVNKPDAEGQTLLMAAAKTGIWDIHKYMNLLISLGADPEKKDASGKKAQDYASGEALTYLKSLAVSPLSDQDLQLIEAVVQNDLKAVQSAIQAGAKPTAAEKERTIGYAQFKGACALHYVARRDSNLEMARLLFGLPGINVDVKDHQGNTPLHILLSQWQGPGRVELTKLLIKQGAEVDSLNANGQTPLFGLLSAYQFTDEVELLELLFEEGADVESVAEKLLHHVQESVVFKFDEVNDKAGKLRVIQTLQKNGLKLRKLDPLLQEKYKEHLK